MFMGRVGSGQWFLADNIRLVESINAVNRNNIVRKTNKSGIDMCDSGNTRCQRLWHPLRVAGVEPDGHGRILQSQRPSLLRPRLGWGKGGRRLLRNDARKGQSGSPSLGSGVRSSETGGNIMKIRHLAAAAMFLACSTAPGANGNRDTGIPAMVASDAAAGDYAAPSGPDAPVIVVKEDPPGEVYRGIGIRTNHPRLWWNNTRLAQAKAYYSAHPFDPDNYRSGDGQEEVAMDHALHYLLTGSTDSARTAIKVILQDLDDIDKQSWPGKRDYYRWDYSIPVVFDWCYDQLTQSERDSVVKRYGGLVQGMMAESWGGPNQNMYMNNYFWGYFRGEMEWALATYYEDKTHAQSILDFALTQRWEGDFVPHSKGWADGGMLKEGFQYGPYMADYRTIFFKTLALNGRDLDMETDFFKQTVYYLIYSRTNAKTYKKGSSAAPFYQFFPFSADEKSEGYPAADNGGLADFMHMMASDYATKPLGQYARQWLNDVQTSPRASRFVEVTESAPGTARSFGDLALDYYSQGKLLGRNRWTADSTQVDLRLSINDTNTGDKEIGAFQIWRSGYFVTKESTGYGDQFFDTNSDAEKAHNEILVGGFGYGGQQAGAGNDDKNGYPEIKRMESRDRYLYAAVDLTSYFRNDKLSGGGKLESDNPYAGAVVREFLFIRPLDTLVVLDRVRSIVDSARIMVPGPKTPEEVEKTQLIHSPYKPTIDGQRALAVNGNQALRVVSVSPANTTFSVVYEGDGAGADKPESMKQYRLQITAKGQQDTHLLTVCQARDSSGQDLALDFSEDANQMTLTLTHPTLGRARVRFLKGMSSTGGDFGYSASSDSISTAPLLDRVQKNHVTVDGPQWEPLGS
jgi:hypothetical protein